MGASQWHCSSIKRSGEHRMRLGGVISYGRWTKAMKYLLTNLKWLMAYIESEPLPTYTDEDDMVASA